jgi:hypothetical protein
MIPPTPYEHRFTLDGDTYCLVGWTRGADRRIRSEYAMAIAAAPQVLDAIDGADLYAEAVAHECLTEAPDLFWETRPAVPGVNGTPTRVVSLERVPLDLWERFREEVGTFVKVFRPGPTEVPGVAPAPGPGDADAVAALETVPPRLRGRAE